MPGITLRAPMTMVRGNARPLARGSEGAPVLPAVCPSVIALLLLLVTKEEGDSVQVLGLLIIVLIGEAVVVQLLIKLILLPLGHIVLVVFLLLTHLQPQGALGPRGRARHSAPRKPDLSPAPLWLGPYSLVAGHVGPFRLPGL